MGYYEDEILEELNIGEQYSDKQLKIFVIEKRNATIISTSCNQFSDYTLKTHTVINIIEGYEHKGTPGTYHVPCNRSKIYIVD